MALKITEYDFRPGDEVVTTSGARGVITEVCHCDRCRERGFFEPYWEESNDSIGDYITIDEAKRGFKGFYRIGKYYFNSFDRTAVLKDLRSLQNSCREIVDCLIVMDEEETRKANQ